MVYFIIIVSNQKIEDNMSPHIASVMHELIAVIRLEQLPPLLLQNAGMYTI